MNIADILREAAALLDEKASLAAAGPWTCSLVWSARSKSTSGVYSRAYPTGTVESEVVASATVRKGYGGIRSPRNADYITMMQPRVAGALAAHLREVADQYQRVPIADVPLIQSALAVARAVLGEAP